MTKDLRPAIIRAHEKGKGVREIARFLNISPATVSRAIKRFEETGSNKDRERVKTARNRRNIQRAKAMISRNPTTKVLNKFCCTNKCFTLIGHPVFLDASAFPND